MPWPTNSRTTENPAASACFWIDVADVREAPSGPDDLDRQLQALPGDLEQALRRGRDLADRHGDRRVPDETRRARRRSPTDSTSPSRSLRSADGIPCTMTSLTDVHRVAG